jgi:hypothetical protein
MSDFLRKREAFNKAYTKSLNDISDDDVLRELPSVFQTMLTDFHYDGLEYNRAILVQLKLEDKLTHKFDKSTAYDYMTCALDALDQCKRDLRLDQLGVIVGERCDEELATTIKAELAACKEQLTAKDNKLKFEEQFNKKIWDQVKVHEREFKVHDAQIKANEVQMKANEVQIKANYAAAAANAVLIKANADRLKLKDELLASKETELAVCKEQLKAKEELMVALEREVEQVVGEDQLKQLKFKIHFEHLKKTKTVEECWAELPEQIQNVLLDKVNAKQAPKGKPLACISNA